MSWRADDEILLRRLEDEMLVGELVVFMTAAVADGATHGLHPRAGGLAAELRKRADAGSAIAAALDGDPAVLARFIDELALTSCSPELIHHLALHYASVAAALERAAPEQAAWAWVRSLAAWLALAEERTYLTRLERAVLGHDAPTGRRAERGARDETIPPERVPLELVAAVARRADTTARELGPEGRAALLALSRTDDAARVAGAPPAAASRVRAFAQRRRNAAIEAALAPIGEALEDARARGDLAASGRDLLVRAVAVWSWTSGDEAVEHFVVDWIEKIGWEHYRASRWDALRGLLDPFRPMFESLATRIERDPAELAYAAGCAQMFVFLSEVDRVAATKRELAERAVKICPTHRNGRLVLASVLCDEAMSAIQGMVLPRRAEVARVEALLARVEALYPETRGLDEARRLLERASRRSISI